MRILRLLPALLLTLSIVGCTAPRGGSGGGGGSGDDDDAADDDDDVTPYGPENSWYHANASDVPDGLEGTGFRVGDTPYNWTFTDQHGDEVELYQFYGQTVLLDVFAEWCGPCQSHAPTGEDIWQEVRDRGVTVLAMMQQVNGGAAPQTAEDAARWADAYGLTHPVVADSEESAGEFVDIGGGFPTYPLIGPDMTIIYADVYPPSIDLLTQVLEDQGIW